MKCINTECDRKQDIDDLTICSRCYIEYYLEDDHARNECLSVTLKRLSE